MRTKANVMELVGPREACEILGISRATLWYRTRLGTVPSVAVTRQSGQVSYSYDPDQLRKHVREQGGKASRRKASVVA